MSINIWTLAKFKVFIICRIENWYFTAARQEHRFLETPGLYCIDFLHSNYCHQDYLLQIKVHILISFSEMSLCQILRAFSKTILKIVKG